jgi:protein-tyrosine kinase
LILNENIVPEATAQEPTRLICDHIRHQLIQMGKLTPAQAGRVQAQARRRDITFAETALAMGMIYREDLMLALSRQYSYPILHGDAESARFSRELVVGHEPFGAAAEVIRSIRSSLAVSVVKEGTRSFLITAPRPGTGSSFFAGNLAVAFAQMSLPTLLVDADLRTPRIAEMFGVLPLSAFPTCSAARTWSTRR